MAYDEQSAQRIRQILFDKKVFFSEKKMFSGVCFMVDDKMCCATHFDKKANQNLLLCRISEEVYETEIEKDECMPMEFTGKPMKGFLFITEDGCKTNKQLSYWLQLCLDFNPFVKASKKLFIIYLLVI